MSVGFSNLIINVIGKISAIFSINSKFVVTFCCTVLFFSSIKIIPRIATRNR